MSEQDDRGRLIESFVNAVYVYDDKVVLTFNYKEGSIVLDLNVLESSDLGALSPPINTQLSGRVAVCFTHNTNCKKYILERLQLYCSLKNTNKDMARRNRHAISLFHIKFAAICPKSQSRVTNVIYPLTVFDGVNSLYKHVRVVACSRFIVWEVSVPR